MSQPVEKAIPDVQIELSPTTQLPHPIETPNTPIRQIGGKDKYTENPEPHSLIKHLKYPKTGRDFGILYNIGGRLGRNTLLWGNELKHSYFPFVCILGPDWITLLFTYAFLVVALVYDAFQFK